MIHITIRNKRVLRWLDFEPHPLYPVTTVTLSGCTWLLVLWRKFKGSDL